VFLVEVGTEGTGGRGEVLLWMAAGQVGAWTDTGIGGFFSGLGASDVDLPCLNGGLIIGGALEDR
jgi:hypothetical protein